MAQGDEQDEDKKGKYQNKQRPNNLIKNKVRLMVGIAITIPMVYLSWSAMWGLPIISEIKPHDFPYRFAVLQSTLLFMNLVIHTKTLKAGLKGLARLNPTAETAVTIGACVTLLYGLYNTYLIGFEGRGELVTQLHYDAVAIMLLMSSYGEYRRVKIEQGIPSSWKELRETGTVISVKVLEDGTTQSVRVNDLQVGDIVRIYPNKRIPIDGKIIQGVTVVDESAVTGRSLPVIKKEGSHVLGGTKNIQTEVLLEVTEMMGDTKLGNIKRLMSGCKGTKPTVAKDEQVFLRVYLPTVYVVAFLCAVYAFTHGGGERSVAVFCVVVLMATPSAYGLATSLAVSNGVHKGVSEGIVCKEEEVLKVCNDVDVILFSKTGTLTYGKPNVTDYKVYNYQIEHSGALTISKEEDELLYEESKFEILRDMASLASVSGHPYSKAIVEEYRQHYKTKLVSPTWYESLDGNGMKGVVRNRRYAVGNKQVIESMGMEVPEEDYLRLTKEGKEVICIVRGNKFVGMIGIADTVREEAKQVIDQLTKKGCEVVMITGDSWRVSRAVASELGIKEVKSGLTPENKVKVVKDYQSKGKTVATIGCGCIDAPCLMQSDVGITLLDSEDEAVKDSDVVLENNTLLDVLATIQIGEDSTSEVRTNIFLATVYHVLGIPLTVGIITLENTVHMTTLLLGVTVLSVCSLCINTKRKSLLNKPIK